jgi:hypothetical protein
MTAIAPPVTLKHMYDSVRAGFLDFITPFEGRVKYMYLDSLGLVTVGVGNLIDSADPQASTPEQALALPFVRHVNGDPDIDGDPATAEEITGDWWRLKTRPELAKTGHLGAKPLTTVHLTGADIDTLVARRLQSYEDELRKTPEFADLDDWPADAQLGLLSMAWAMGGGFASGGRWPDFRGAVAARDWTAAAGDSHIGNGAPARNAADAQLFSNARRVVDEGLDLSVLLFLPEVRNGSSGDAVSRLQQRLTDLGYACPVTGFFDGDTDSAVKSFQRDNGLGPDGVVGPKTWAALGF